MVDVKILDYRLRLHSHGERRIKAIRKTSCSYFEDSLGLSRAVACRNLQALKDVVWSQQLVITVPAIDGAGDFLKAARVSGLRDSLQPIDHRTAKLYSREKTGHIILQLNPWVLQKRH